MRLLMWRTPPSPPPPRPKALFLSHQQTSSRPRFWHAHAYFPPRNRSLYRGGDDNRVSDALISPTALQHRDEIIPPAPPTPSTCRFELASARANFDARSRAIKEKKKQKRRARFVRLRDYRRLHFIVNRRKNRLKRYLGSAKNHPPTSADALATRTFFCCCCFARPNSIWGEIKWAVFLAIAPNWIFTRAQMKRR